MMEVTQMQMWWYSFLVISSEVKKYNFLSVTKLMSAFSSSSFVLYHYSTLQMQHRNVNGTCSNNSYQLSGPHPENDAQHPPTLKSPNLEKDWNVSLLLMSSSA